MPEKSIDEKMYDMNIAINKNRSPLAAAFLEDEAVRISSQDRSREYILNNEKDHSGMRSWMWNLLYFALGMLVALTVPSSLSNIITFFKNSGM